MNLLVVFSKVFILHLVEAFFAEVELLLFI